MAAPSSGGGGGGASSGAGGGGALPSKKPRPQPWRAFFSAAADVAAAAAPGPAAAVRGTFAAVAAVAAACFASLSPVGGALAGAFSRATRSRSVTQPKSTPRIGSTHRARFVPSSSLGVRARRARAARGGRRGPRVTILSTRTAWPVGSSPTFGEAFEAAARMMTWFDVGASRARVPEKKHRRSER